MTSTHRIVVSRSLFPGTARLLAASLVVVCSLHIGGRLWGQTPIWNNNGSTTMWSSPTSVSVGIGTSTPSATLQVAGSTLFGNYGTSNWWPYSDGNDYIQLTTNASFNIQSQAMGFADVFVVHGNGQVGIGTLVHAGQCGNATQPCLLTVNGANRK